MEITKNDAQESIEQIQSITNRLRKSIAASSASPLLILWGLIWIVGYGSSQFYPEQAGLVWGPLCFLGGIASWVIGARTVTIRTPGSWRFGLFWVALFGYAALWTVLLHPFNQAHTGAYIGTVPMFAYVVGGLWLGRFFTWLGLTVTALIVLGVFAWPAWSELWTGLAGGGSLIIAGLFIRKFWGPA